MKKAWLGSGGNVGNVKDAMAFALQIIDEHTDCKVIKTSSVYRTPPWGNENQDDFLNAVWEIETALEPEDLFRLCLDLEKKRLRERIIKWGPRTLDIDLLVYEGMDNYHSSTLTIPHLHLTERAFVLVPLHEISPLLFIKGKTVTEWTQLIEKDGIEKLNFEKNWWKY